MSQLSGYDSEAVGFDSITRNKQTDTDGSTQTSEYSESGTGTQTMTSKSCGTNVRNQDLETQNTAEYPPPGLNEFLRRVVPSMLEQLDINQREVISDLSESDDDEEEIISAKLFQKINLMNEYKGSGDNTPDAILSLSLNSLENSIAASIGRTYHDEWCQHSGVIKIFNIKRSDDNKFVPFHEISESSCVSVVLYHPNISALLAYGTLSGDVGVCNLRSVQYEESIQLKAPANCHGSKLISYLHWAEPELSTSLLTLKTHGKRHGSTDQVLFSSGNDGRINVWQVNANLNVIELIISYQLNGINKSPAEDITCFDFLRNYSLSGLNIADEVFIVGTKSGKILVCKTKSCQKILNSDDVDPVYESFEGITTCILNIISIVGSGGFFASLSTDGELRVYDVTQKSPFKVIQLEETVSRMVRLNNSIIIFGLAKVKKQEEMIKLYNLTTQRYLTVDGLKYEGDLDCASVTSISCLSSTRVAVGDDTGVVRIWEIPFKTHRNQDFNSTL